MKYVQLGSKKASAIGVGLGNWNEEFDPHMARKIVERALELGVNFFDTAELYGGSEETLGRALGDLRNQAIIATKVNKWHLRKPDVVNAVGSSRARLKVTSIDLYQVHWPNLFVPASSTMSGMREVMASSEIAHVGVSNYSLRLWQKADKALDRAVVSNQVPFSLVDQAPIKHLLPFAQAQGRVIIAYSPIAQGLLGGRYSSNRLPGDYRDSGSFFKPVTIERARPLLARLDELGKKYDSSPAQIALAWLIRMPNVMAIPGVKSVAQLEENANAANIELSPAEWQELQSLGTAVRIKSGKQGVKAAAAWVLGY